MAFKFLANLFGAQSADAKTLEQSRAQLASAKASAEVVAALFTTAGLDLDAMIEAGPDALKAHLASLSAKDADLAAAQAKVKELETAIAETNHAIAASADTYTVYDGCFKAIGMAGAPSKDQAKALFDSHVKQAAALELAKTGHAPVDDVITTTHGQFGVAIDPTLTGADRTKAFFASKLTSKK